MAPEALDPIGYSREVFLNRLGQTTPFPLALPVARAEGIYLYAPDGKRYMDLIAGLGVNNIGHRHPAALRAIGEQLDKHLHVMAYGEYIQSTPNQLAQVLAEQLPPSLNCAYFVNSGTEANEAALKLAKRATGRVELVACAKSYHGSTHGALSVSADGPKKDAFRPLLPYIKLIAFNDMAGLKTITRQTACVLVETIQGDAGVRIPTLEYLSALRHRCNETGALLAFDEVQCGMGRTGPLFAFERFGVVPDILTLGKALGGGLPLGAFVADRKLMSLLSHGPVHGHITTFGGNPVSCAAALATLRVMHDENVCASVEQKGKLFAPIAAHRAVVEMRRAGLMICFDLESPEMVDRVVKRALEGGAVCFYFLSHRSGLRLAPPLTISEDEIAQACDIVLTALEQATQDA